jgi:lipopolysaccharide transport system ATP-binding protein
VVSDIAIRVDGLGKRYHIGRQRGYRTLREAITEAVAHPFQRPTSFRGQTAAKPGVAFDKNHIWALKDVSFEVRHGEVLGVIGRNGSGKSTLLKILSRITDPTEGTAEIHGRVGSLLEVGTGFHPELTGRENIYLSGVILGMKKAETRQRFDEIVDFAEIGEFIDTPVKHYSSGMYVRLAFAVAAHLGPDLLFVDEVLAVGDASFQKRCLGRMSQAAQTGRTILFVSHNMGAIASLCGRCLVLDSGRVVFGGAPVDAISVYTGTQHPVPDASTGTALADLPHTGTGRGRFVSLRVTPLGLQGASVSSLLTGGDLQIWLEVRALEAVFDANVAVTVYDANGYRIVDVNTALRGVFLSLAAGETAAVEFRVRNLLLRPGRYTLSLWLGRGAVEEMDAVASAAAITVEPNPAALRHSEVFPGVYQCDFYVEVKTECTKARGGS